MSSDPLQSLSKQKATQLLQTEPVSLQITQDGRTASASVNPRYVNGKFLKEWPTAERDLRDAAAPYASSLDALDVLRYDLPEYFFASNKAGVVARFIQNVCEPVIEVVKQLEMFKSYRFSDFQVAEDTFIALNPPGSHSKLFPDLMLVKLLGTAEGRVGSGCVVVELKTPWTKPAHLKKLLNFEGETHTFFAPHDAAHGAAVVVGQLIHYMVKARLRYGFMSDYDRAIFVERTGELEFYVSKPFYRHPEPGFEGRLSIREAIFAFIVRTGGDFRTPAAWDVPPEKLSEGIPTSKTQSTTTDMRKSDDTIDKYTDNVGFGAAGTMRSYAEENLPLEDLSVSADVDVHSAIRGHTRGSASVSGTSSSRTSPGALLGHNRSENDPMRMRSSTLPSSSRRPLSSSGRQYGPRSSSSGIPLSSSGRGSQSGRVSRPIDTSQKQQGSGVPPAAAPSQHPRGLILQQNYKAGMDTLFLFPIPSAKRSSMSFHVKRIMFEKKDRLIMECLPVLDNTLLENRPVVVKLWLENECDGDEAREWMYNEYVVHNNSRRLPVMPGLVCIGYINSLVPGRSGLAVATSYRPGESLEGIWDKLGEARKNKLKENIFHLVKYLKNNIREPGYEQGVVWMDCTRRNILYDKATDQFTFLDFEFLKPYQHWSGMTGEFLWKGLEDPESL